MNNCINYRYKYFLNTLKGQLKHWRTVLSGCPDWNYEEKLKQLAAWKKMGEIKKKKNRFSSVTLSRKLHLSMKECSWKFLWRARGGTPELPLSVPTQSIIALMDIFTLFTSKVVANKKEPEGEDAYKTMINPEPRWALTTWPLPGYVWVYPLGGASGRCWWPRVQHSSVWQQRCYLIHQLLRRHSALKLPPRCIQETRVSYLSWTV